MPGVDDWVTNPLRIVHDIFERDCHGNWEDKVNDYFKKKLENVHVLQAIPSLNDIPLHKLQNNMLVRFRCMIQDMFDPEFFLGVYELVDIQTNEKRIHCGLYRDLVENITNFQLDPDSTHNVTKDRLTYYCISVPGENKWVKEAYAERSRCGHSLQPFTSHAPPRPKRPLEESEETQDLAMDTEDCDRSSANLTEDEIRRKRNRLEISADSHSSGHTENAKLDLNIPLADTEAVTCMVKIYHQVEEFKMNDVVEFVGILSVDPSLVQFGAPGVQSFWDSFDNEENQARSPPPSLVPRLHAIKGYKLHHHNPLLPMDVKSEDSGAVVESILSEAKELRSHLHAIFQQALLGDGLAADYLICHLLSSVYVRKDDVTLGKFCLNLSNVPVVEGYATELHKLIETLTTKSYLLQLTLDNMNSLTFIPKKDHNANRLKTGLLQLSEHTHLVINETCLSPGRLQPNGMKNITALGNLITWQKVDYDFTFHNMEFSTNIPTLVLSEGKSLLPADCQVPIVASTETPSPGTLAASFAAIHNYLTPTQLCKLRTYLGLLRLLDFSLSDEVQQMVQDDFVEMRRRDAANVTLEDLHGLLVVARLLSLSYGNTVLSREIWEKTKEMSARLKERVGSRVPA